MRIPSSFHSTDARSKPATASATLSAVDASIGRIGRKSSKPTAAKPLLALGHRDLGRARQIAREHQRAPRELAGDAGGLRDRVDHQPRERALPQPAGEEPPDEVGLLLGRAAEKSSPRISRRAAADPLPVASWTRADRAVEVVDRERRLPRRARARPRTSSSSRSPIRPCRGDAGEEADRDRHLARARAAPAARRGSRSSAERELVSATSVDAATTSASSVTARRASERTPRRRSSGRTMPTRRRRGRASRRRRSPPAGRRPSCNGGRDARGSMNFSGSDSTSASRNSFGKAKPISVSSRENAR